MRLLALTLLLLLGIVVLTMLPAGPTKGTSSRERRPRDAGVTDEQAAIFAVLDDLFPYEVEHRPFVEVELGHLRRFRDRWNPAVGPNHYRYGFLLADEGQSFRVQFLDGERAHLTISPTGTTASCRTRYTRADLFEHALYLATRAAQLGMFYGGPTYGEPISPLTRALLAARALARLGRTDDCAAVWRALPPHWQTLEGLIARPEVGSLMTCPFVEDLANRVALDFDDLSLSWADLLERHDRFLAHIASDSYSAEKTRERRDSLARAPGASRWSLWQSSADKTIDELRNTARPEAGGSWAGVWSVERFEPCPAAQTAFDRIVAAGLDRVPDLIAALEDRSPSRSVCYYRGKGGAFIDVREVGSVARQALSILYGGDDVIRTESMITRMGVDEWRDWYSRVKQSGLRPFLAAKMREEADAAAAARSYLRLWPDDGGAVLDAMVDANDGTWLDLLTALEACATASRGVRERLVAMLRTTMGKPSWRRSFAASALLHSGDEHGAKLLGEARQRGENLTEEEWLVLLESGLPEPWQAVERRLDDPIDRAGLLHVLRQSSREAILERADDAARPTIDHALRRCLLRLLTETETWGGSSCTETGATVVHDRRRVSMHRASVADFAACALSSGWPEAFRFDPRAIGYDRRRQIVQLLRQMDRAPSSVGPPDVPGPGNVVGSVLFEGAALTDEERAMISAFVGKPFDIAAAASTLRAICRQNGAVVALHCERRPGSCLVIRCASRPVAVGERGGGPLEELVITREGETSRTVWVDSLPEPVASEFSLVLRP